VGFGVDPLPLAASPRPTILENESPDAGDCITSVSREAFAAAEPKPSGAAPVFEPALSFFIFEGDDLGRMPPPASSPCPALGRDCWNCICCLRGRGPARRLASKAGVQGFDGIPLARRFGTLAASGRHRWTPKGSLAARSTGPRLPSHVTNPPLWKADTSSTPCIST
jgi:hypothetical protein